jgi:Transposase
MDHFAGLDVSVKETSICIVDDAGKIVREVKVASEPEALLAVLKNPAYHFKRIGLEAGPLSQWLFSVLAEAGLPVICVETRHMQAVLKAQINKTYRRIPGSHPDYVTADAYESSAHYGVFKPTPTVACIRLWAVGKGRCPPQLWARHRRKHAARGSLCR